MKKNLNLYVSKKILTFHSTDTNIENFGNLTL